MEHLVELTDTEIESVSGGLFNFTAQANTVIANQGALAISIGSPTVGGLFLSPAAGGNATNSLVVGQANIAANGV